MTCAPGIHVHPCSALVDGACRNGFPVSRGCLPVHSINPERWVASVPACCDEGFPFNGDASRG